MRKSIASRVSPVCAFAMIRPFELQPAGAMPVPRLSSARASHQARAYPGHRRFSRLRAKRAVSRHDACLPTVGARTMANDKDSTTGPVRGHKSDTSSYEQLHGEQDSKTTPNRRNEKMPHERDESARSTGN